MKINRDSWHYRWRKCHYIRGGHDNIIEWDVSPLMYWVDVMFAVFAYFWRPWIIKDPCKNHIEFRGKESLDSILGLEGEEDGNRNSV